MISYELFAQRVATLRERIAAACLPAGRDPATVTLLAVTKTHPVTAAEYAARAGLTAVGENRVQEAVNKRSECTAAIRWELIGHLQSNKAKVAAANFDRVQSVDSPKLLTLLDRAAGELGRTLPVLLQINAGQDPAKFGAEPEDAERLVQTALALPRLRLDGLMTIAPLSDDPAVAERTFANLRAIRDELAARCGTPLPELSMGMSGDLEPAIAAGSTCVRVGSALYGERG
ncbi:MAG: YggS family pyridoxal phosphate-dependent enzyme [Verrucomicrobiota bacterium]